jgi:signal transduction histidine kinase
VTQSFDDDVAAVARIDSVSKILDVVCRTTGMGFAAVARVTEDRWIACAVRDDISFGLKPGGELKVETTICNEIRASGELVVIDHVAEDAAYCRHKTPQMYGFQSYISVPIRRPDGRFFGTLCAIDPRPARLDTPETISMFKLFAELIGFHLDTYERLSLSEKALGRERETAELREQFIAVLGHDLRNPLTAINASAELLGMSRLDARGARLVAMIQSSAVRIAGLVDNLLDFARARLGSGLSVTPVANSELDTVLEQVIAELRVAWPDRDIATDIDLARPVACDGPRIAQMFSNLLANALTHGAADRPVSVRARSDDRGFDLSVANPGKPIAPDIAERLFQPFARGAGSGQQGLGLGLFIASEIARAHGGTLDLASTAEETRFTFRIPTTPRR